MQRFVRGEVLNPSSVSRILLIVIGTFLGFILLILLAYRVGHT
jgi:hypothetical protein